MYVEDIPGVRLFLVDLLKTVLKPGLYVALFFYSANGVFIKLFIGVMK